MIPVRSEPTTALNSRTVGGTPAVIRIAANVTATTTQP
jgi:hypothetical protein